MRLGVRSILLLVAVILFIVAAISNDNFGDLLAFGLAAFAAAFLVDDFGLDAGGRGRRVP
jgi:hypothetical protein